MKKSATELMQEILAAAMLDAIAALKAASKGVPNNLLRDLNAIHANTTFDDLPREVQTAIAASVRSGFARLMKEGYAVAPASGPPPRPGPPRQSSGPSRPQHGRGPGNKPRGPGGPDGKPPRKGGPNGGRPPR